MPVQNDSPQSLPTALRGTRARIVGLVVAAAALSGMGFLLGTRQGGPMWHEGQAYVGQEKTSIQAEDWTYGISGSVAWIDADGGHHDDGRPECLSVPVGTSVAGVKFATVDVKFDEVGWREVVLVDCRTR